MDNDLAALSCCFTGHRDLSNDELLRLSQLLAETIRELYRDGVRVFYAGGAVGCDMLAAITVVNLKAAELHDISLTIALPCERHYAGWGKRDRDLLARLLERADEVVYVSREYSPHCMKDRNEYMVSHCSVCVCCLYPERYRGGTAQTVRLARSGGLRVINLADRADISV